MFMLETDRFAGKNVVEVPVADGIKRPEELINMAQDDSQPFVAKNTNVNNQQRNQLKSKALGKQFINT